MLALDNDNLNSAVQTIYGPHADGERYLRKFFDMEFFLPPVTSKIVIKNLMVEHGHVKLADLKAFETDISNERQVMTHRALGIYDSPSIPSFAVALTDLCIAYDLSIRDLTQIMTALTAVIRSCALSQPLVPYALCLGLVCRFVDSKGFANVITGQTGLSEWYGTTFYAEHDGHPTPQKTNFHQHVHRISHDSVTAQYIKAYRAFGRVSHVNLSNEMHSHDWKDCGSGIRAKIENDFEAARRYFSGNETLDHYVCGLLRIAGQVVTPIP